MNASRNPGLYHQTSVDRAKAAHTTVTLVAQKRKFDEHNGRDNKELVDVASRVEFRRPAIQLGHSVQPLNAGSIRDIIDRGPSAYSQRRSLALTPTPTSNPLLDLSHRAYGLPKQLIANFASLGIRSIYPWQSECLLRSGALAGESNLVYTAPTGGGKSLVADVLMLKKVLENPGKKALLVLPYVALVQEKQRWLRRAVDGIANPSTSNEERPTAWRGRGDEDCIRVVGIYGGSKQKASWDDMDIVVCTIEKANALVNAAIEDLSIGKIGCVVMDELHMIDDENRGYVLELMATKLLSLDIEGRVQIIGMSATLSNAELLAKWLSAKFYISRYRPVPIEEHLVFDNAIYPASSSNSFYETATQLNAQTGGITLQQRPQPCRTIEQSSDRELSNPLINAVVSLANETARAGYGALVFCSSRTGCERNAILISQVLPRAGEVNPETMVKRSDMLNSLRTTTTGLDHVLERTVPLGVAFHQDAGLTTEERDIIATAYDEGTIRVIVATCSLAAGINLPARRVILHGARMGADLVGPSMLRQMRGRAGRKGKDEIGETYLCCQQGDLEAVAGLMDADLSNVESCLTPGKRGINRALLEAMATKLATSEEALNSYIRNTLLYCSIDRVQLARMVGAAVDALEKSALVERGSGTEYSATTLGQAIVASSLTPEDGLFVYRELQRAMQALVMDGDMHVLYLFTPVQSTRMKINWQVYGNEVERLDASNLRALNLVGLKPLTIIKLAQGGSLKDSKAEEMETARIYRRFYAALQLRDLCNEMPIHAVARKYDVPRGVVQTLAQACHGFAAGMIKFCERMNWGALASVLDHFSDRLRAGAKADLLSLAKITYVKSRTARVFWENGFKSVAAVAAADTNDILPILIMAQPKKLKLPSHYEEKYMEKLKSKAAIIISSANKNWELQMQQELEGEDFE